jgi:hypothetical protein
MVCGVFSWQVLRETVEEKERKGDFECIFPTAATHAEYGDLFETPRYNNVLVAKWLELPKDVQQALVSSRGEGGESRPLLRLQNVLHCGFKEAFPTLFIL